MKTEGIGITNPYNNYQNKTGSGKATNDKTPADIFKLPEDTYIPSAPKGAADPATIESLWKETNHAGEAVRKLIASALGIDDANGQGFWALKAKNFQISEADRAQAQALISEDGYFGVKQTSERLFKFAQAMVGENASEKDIENMRKATQKGFDEVAKMFGGFDKLPEVTKETYKATMAMFDDWKAAATGTSTGTDTE